MSDVIDFEKAKREKSEKPPKIAKDVVCQELAKAMLGTHLALKPFPVKLGSYTPDGLLKIPYVLDEDTRQVNLVTESYIVDLLLKYTRTELAPLLLYNSLSHRDAIHTVRLWLSLSTPTSQEEIADVRWLGEAGLTFHRLPWELKPLGDGTPLWDEILSRMTNAEAFKAYVGSLFFPKGYRQSYCWIYGKGNDGKGAINRTLQKVFRTAYISRQPPNIGDRFWTRGLVGKRVLVFPDCNNTSYVTSGDFKSLSGDDHIPAEIKGGASFDFKPKCMIFFFSNEKPSISSETADIRRIILCEISARAHPTFSEDYEERLFSESGTFLSNCVQLYASKYRGCMPVLADLDLAMDLADSNEEHFQEVFDEHFEVVDDPRRACRSALRLSRLAVHNLTTNPTVLQKMLKDIYPQVNDQRRFKSWLKKKYDIDRRTVYFWELDGNMGSTKAYVGIRVKMTEKNSWE